MAENPYAYPPIGSATPSAAEAMPPSGFPPRTPSITHTANAAEDERRSSPPSGAAPGSPSAAFCQGGFNSRFVSNASLSRTQLRPGPLRVAAYIRVSTDSADQENSYEAQERYFSSLLLHHPEWIGAGIYADYGLSGTSGERRTGYSRLLRHCREERLDRASFDFFLRCLQALPRTNAAGQPLCVPGLHAPGSPSAAYDLLPFDKGIYLAFVQSGLVRGDTVEYVTRFGVTLVAEGNSRSLSDFLGFRRAEPDGTVAPIDAPWKVTGRGVRCIRRNQAAGTKR